MELSILKSSESEVQEQLSFLRETFPKNIVLAKGVCIEEAKIEAEREISRLLSDEYKDYFFTAFLGSTPIGYTWLRSQIDERFITYLYVLPSHRNSGLGSRIMNWIDTFATDSGFKRIGLVVFANNSTAVSLYERSGYSIGNIKMTKQILS